MRSHTRLATVVRLGEGVDRRGRLHRDSVERTRACLGEYELRLKAYRPARRLLVATSALRDAADGPNFLEAAEGDFHLPYRVLSGGEEAALAFRGGTAELAAASPVLLVDIGGGGVELAVGSPGLPPAFVRSLDIGVVRLTERFLSTDPPTPRELEDLTAFVAAAVAEVAAQAVAGGAPAAVRSAVGVAGTFTTLVAHKLGLRTYRPELVHGHVLSVADLEAAIQIFRRLTNAERGRLPGVQRGREDVILAGVVIAREVCRAFGLGEIRCSEADLLEGAALALAEGSLLPG